MFTFKIKSFLSVYIVSLIISSFYKKNSVYGDINPPIRGDAISTLRIVTKLCYIPGDHSNKIARPFYGCYDYAPGKEQFSKCQRKIFGNILNTESRIDVSCKLPFLLVGYVKCLMEEFRKAGINMTKAVTKVNICQAKVLGITS